MAASPNLPRSETAKLSKSGLVELALGFAVLSAVGAGLEAGVSTSTGFEEMLLGF